jgi:citrate lyase beta subunit
MSKQPSKSVPRAFPWRKSFLSSLAKGAKVVDACRSAGISRNTVYTHLRKDAAFGRQWERAFYRGLDARFVDMLRDPEFQRLVQRVGLP